MKTRYLSLVAILILFMVPLLLLGCSQQPSPASTSPVPPAPPAATSATTSSGAPAVLRSRGTPCPAAQTTKTLKIGVVLPMGSDIGVDGKKALELMAESDNKAGGVDIGGEKYQVQLVQYDNLGRQAGETLATNRLVFEDKVSFIITIGQYQGAWIKTTEANKVIVMTMVWIQRPA